MKSWARFFLNFESFMRYKMGPEIGSIMQPIRIYFTITKPYPQCYLTWE